MGWELWGFLGVEGLDTLFYGEIRGKNLWVGGRGWRLPHPARIFAAVRYMLAKGGTMVSIQLEYEGNLHCRAVHGSSKTVLTTDAPKDNEGRGESFFSYWAWWQPHWAVAS